MSNYVIYTDSACDIKPELLKEWGVGYEPLTLRFTDSDEEFKNDEISAYDFYLKMRAGGVAKTAAVNSEAFREAFASVLKSGMDLLYLGFSSGLSTTFNSARIAANELKEEFPDRKIEVVDTLSASAGFGLLLYLVLEKKNAGATIEEARAYAEELVPKLCHWFTVDDLVYLKRGGRISPLAASVGNMLGIKPVLHMDLEGHLINKFKVRGRRAAIGALADKLGELMTDKTQGPVFICHGDCADDAALLSSIIKEKYGLDTDITVYTGPVIGAHSGPGTLALFFIGNER
jgi:DegV family protein with EDD domain